MRTQVPLTPEQQKLVEEHTPLVFYVALKREHIPRALYEDLVGRLFYRLCVAVSTWNPDLGYKISSYLVASLQGEMKTFFRDEVWHIRPPRPLRERPYEEVLGEAEQGENGESAEVLRTCARPLPLDGNGIDDRSGLDLLTEDPQIEDRVVSRIGGNQILREVFAALQIEERVVLALRMKGKPLSEIQRRFGVSRSVVSTVWKVLQKKVARMYLDALEGKVLIPSEGNQPLRRALREQLETLESPYVKV